MIVVSDTTAVTSLLKIGESELLHVLFGEIVIPCAVHAELLSYHGKLPPWLIIQAVSDPNVLEELLERLDLGEAEAIALAKASQADVLIIDEKRGRTIAEHLGLHCMGLAGVLLLAKQR